jgi:hypothetical protein
MYDPQRPDQLANEVNWQAEALQREMHDDRIAQAKMLSRVRRVWRRIMGRQDPPASPN